MNAIFYAGVATGIGFVIGRNGWGWLPVIVASLVVAAVYLWATRSTLKVASDNAGTSGGGKWFATLMIWIALSVLVGLVVGLGVLIGAQFPHR